MDRPFFQSVEVELTWREVYLAGVVNVARTVDNLHQGKRDRYGLAYDDMGESRGWMGAIAEIAVAKYLNIYWVTLEPGVIDVGHVEVRAVGAPGHRLLLHDEDRDAPFVSVLVERKRLPVVTLRGWYYAENGKQSEYWAEPVSGRGCYCIPNNLLHPMCELPA